MKELLFLLVFIGLSTAFALAAIVTSVLFAPKSTSDNDTYECGMKLFTDANIQFDVKFFNFAIMFLIFDVETIFLFPFAIYFLNLKSFAIIEAAIFIGLLFFALIYSIKKKLLRWQ